MPTDRRYTGQREESGLGLYDYNARYYDPYINRWIQPDVIVPDAGDPQSLNRFSYVRNNPLKYIDTDGFERIIIVYGIGYSKPTHSFYAAAHTQYRDALAAGYTDDEILFTNVRSDEEFLWAIGKNDPGEIEGVYYFGHGDFADSSGSEGLFQVTQGYEDEAQFMSDEIDPTLENRFSADAQIRLHACVVGATSLPQEMANTWGVSVHASPRTTKFYEPIDGFGPVEYKRYNGGRGTYDYETDVFQLPSIGPKIFNRPDKDAWNRFAPE
jgi:RHS repeat-associated protein